MCTCTAFRQNGLFFGRNMDLDYSFGERVTVMPRKFPLKFSKGEHLAYIGMATVMDGYPLYADAMNEKGLCIAGLNFPHKAFYRPSKEGKINIPAYDFNSYIAANFSSVDQVRGGIAGINITNEPFSENVPCAPLHWMIADSTASVVIESTEYGVNLYENPLDVMTNLPEFPEHIQNYSNVKNGEGSAPTDYPCQLSSPSRFVRIAHFRGNELPPTDIDGIISHVFHLLDTVAMPDVSAKAESGLYHKTTYSACMDAVNQAYCVRTYENSRICKIKMTDDLILQDKFTTYELIKKQDYLYLN